MEVAFEISDKFITMLPGDKITRIKGELPIFLIGSDTHYEVGIFDGEAPDVEKIGDMAYLRNMYSLGSVYDGDVALDIHGEIIGVSKEPWRLVIDNAHRPDNG
jgi:hypothetical protein